MTAKFFEGSAKEGNLALGYRKMTTFGFNLGAWIGGDVRRTEIDNTFWQLSGGFEALSKNVDLRLNWYGPVTKPQTGVAGFAQVHLQGSQIYMTGGEEVGMKGVDGEVGFRLPTEYLKLNPKVFELRAYAGGYHFENEDALEDITGVKGRLEFRINDVIASLPGSRLTVDYEVSHDDVRDTRHDVGMRLRIPLNGGKSAQSLASLSHQQRRMLDGVERDTDIVTARSKAEFVADALTGTNFDRVAYATTASGVTAPSNASGDNSLIILNGEVQGAQTLQGNPTLQGGGSTIQVRGRMSGLILPFTAPGAAGRLTSPVHNDDNLTLEGSNTHVSGITIVGNDSSVFNHGVVIGDNHLNVFLTHLIIENTANGIEIGSGNQLTMDSLSIANSRRNGIGTGGDNTLIAINNVIISNSGWDGIDIGSRNEKVRITNVLISGAAETGLSFSDDNPDIKIANVTILDVGEDGIDFDRRNKVVIDGTTITRTGEHGIAVRSDDDNEITVTNSSLSDIGQNSDAVDKFDAIHLSGENTLRIANTTFAGTIGGNIFNFSEYASTVLPGSTGNINNVTSLGGQVCAESLGGSFTGTIEISGTLLVNGC